MSALRDFIAAAYARARGNLATLNKDRKSAVRLVSQSAASRRATPNKVDLRSWAVFIDWSSMAMARTISISRWSIMFPAFLSFSSGGNVTKTEREKEGERWNGEFRGTNVYR